LTYQTRALGGLLMMIALLAVPGCTGGRGPGDGPVGVGALAPDFELPLLDGGTIRLSDLRGKVVFVNFWATWCPPCLEEMPDMDELNGMLDHPDFVMLSISVDEGGEQAVRGLLGDRSWSFPVLLDATQGNQRLSSRTGMAYGITGVPETFVINQGGYIVRHEVGPRRWANTSQVDYFRRMLAQGDA
jgi:thiol-disulfide isomerase/thioredoxin